jgi:pimeloyl-ACP methyl ester carboxylesterase
MWERQLDLLREHGFDVAAPDLPGFGSEPVPREPFSFVDRVAELLPASLVGNSFGGRIALETALAHPDGVPRLVLVDAGIRDHEFSEAVRRAWAAEEERLAAGDIDGAVEAVLEAWALPEVRDLVRPMQRRALNLQLEHEEPEVSWPGPRPLSELQAETLVLVGERDFDDFHEIGRRIVSEAPNARLEIVAGAGHLPSLEAPDDFDRLLLGFLGRS